MKYIKGFVWIMKSLKKLLICLEYWQEFQKDLKEVFKIIKNIPSRYANRKWRKIYGAKKSYDLLCVYMDSYYYSFDKDEFRHQFQHSQTIKIDINKRKKWKEHYWIFSQINYMLN